MHKCINFQRFMGWTVLIKVDMINVLKIAQIQAG
jgi:hypothetical protein